jgi:hypothetical protein
MMQGTKQNVAINSSPSSATVYLNGTNIGPTPMAAELSRKNTRSNITKIGQTPFQNCDKDGKSTRSTVETVEVTFKPQKHEN